MTNIQNTTANYLSELNEALAQFPVDQITAVASLLFSKGFTGNIFIAGNGGSASTASHMATDLGVGSLRRKNPLRVVSLVDNVAVLTATANDLAFDQVFSQQLLLLGRKDDVFICFSASGNSRNLTNAVTDAKTLGMITISVTGFDGGMLKNMTDYNIHIDTKVGSYGVVEDVHSTVSHLLTEIIRSQE